MQEERDRTAIWLTVIDALIRDARAGHAPSVADVVRLLNNVQFALKRWPWEERSRRGTMPSRWLIDNEAGVQALLWAALAPVYGADLVDEHYLPHWGQVQPRADLGILSLRLIIAVKTLRILGQMLKNFPGSLEGDTKLRIARECYALGLRMIGWMLEEIHRNQHDLLAALVEYHKEHSPRLPDDQAEDRATEAIIQLVDLLGLLSVRLVSSSVGSPDLNQTYARVVEETGTPAFRLINAALRLDHTAIFPESAMRDLATAFRDQPYSRRILAYLVVNHFHMFPVSASIKQRICAALGIEYLPSLGANTHRRLIGP